MAWCLSLTVILLIALCGTPINGDRIQKSFGTGRSQIQITSAKEFELLQHTLVEGSNGTDATITFFW